MAVLEGSRTEWLRDEFLKKTPELCIERARLISESYRKTEGEPMVIRRAKALQKILGEMTIFVEPRQLIVGNHASEYKGLPVFPEYSCEWIDEELEHFEQRTPKILVKEENKKTLREIVASWRGKTVEDYVRKYVSDDVVRADALGAIVRFSQNSGFGVFTPDYEKVLNQGLGQIIKEAEASIRSLEPGRSHQERKKAHFLEAAIIACNAAINFAKRYAREARRLAQSEVELGRRSELERIADICERVPANAARTFHEALQSFFFIFLIVQLESNGRSIALGRFDQYMYPFYKEDKEDRRIAKEGAQELLECLFIKIASIGKLRDSARAALRPTMFQNMTIGGQTADGKDATNELTYLILEAQKNVRMIQPTLSLRYFEGTPDELLMKGLEVVRTGLGMPAFFGDNKIVPTVSAMYGTVPLEEARNYSFIGCVVPVLPGKTEPCLYQGYINQAKCLELALNSGVDPLTGVQLGVRTVDPLTFESIDDVMEAYKEQVDYFLKLLDGSRSIIRRAHIELAPIPFTSCLVKDCMAMGKFLPEGGPVYEYPRFFSGFVGSTNLADSLAAIKKFVYEEKKFSIKELKEALATNFSGKEGFRQMLLNKSPKWGNDEDYVDLIARDAMRLIHRGWPTPNHNFQSTGIHVAMGAMCGATPDGRKAGEALADGGVSPMRGMDTHGPTAVVRSVTKIDQENELTSWLLNMKFDPSVVGDDQGVKNMVALLKTYFDLGGHHVQFNVVTPETLMNAQKEPEKYRDLIVRVSGFSAYFTELPQGVQDDIIARTTFTRF